MKTLIITWENFQDQEVVYPYYRALEEGECHIMSNVLGKFYGIMGVNMTSHLEIKTLDEHGITDIDGSCVVPSLANHYLDTYDLLVLPGGVKALEKLRQEKKVLEFINKWVMAQKIVASTCHGAQLLISAKVTKSKRISGYYSVADDITNSGATYVNEPVVVDGNIVSSPHYDHMAIWLKTAIDMCKERLK